MDAHAGVPRFQEGLAGGEAFDPGKRGSDVNRLFTLATVIVALGLLTGFAVTAGADTVAAINFESPTYTIGDINGQNDWMKTNSNFDVAVASTTRYGFGAQALRLSNSYTTGSFGDQTFSPALTQAAGQNGLPHFQASFDIGTTSNDVQPGLSMSVSPDNGQGARMSYLRFEDQADGIHVFFDDFRGMNFHEKDIATLDRASSHAIEFSIDFREEPANANEVTIFIDGQAVITGKTWERYYPRVGETVPDASTLLFRLSGAAVPANAGNGFLVDNVSLSSS